MAPRRATEWKRDPPLSKPDVVVRQQRAAASVAAEMVKDNMRVGLGTGSTVAQLLEVLSQRELAGVICAATSPATERAARALGMTVHDLDRIGELDMAIDGADQIDPSGWLVKGGGGAHTREKIIVAAARCFVVIASAEKAVERLEPPVPLEVMRFGAETTLRTLKPATLRGDAESPDGGLIADYFGSIEDPRALSARLSATPGVVEHGLFPPEMVNVILIGEQGGVQRRQGGKRGAG
jgi:ribose 5-phosphate isomerase A